MEVPTEPIGGIPRPIKLLEAIAEIGDYTDPKLEAFYDDAVRETIKEVEATGSPVITDGEQRKYHHFDTAFAKIRARDMRTKLASDSLAKRA